MPASGARPNWSASIARPWRRGTGLDPASGSECMPPIRAAALPELVAREVADSVGGGHGASAAGIAGPASSDGGFRRAFGQEGAQEDARAWTGRAIEGRPQGVVVCIVAPVED